MADFIPDGPYSGNLWAPLHVTILLYIWQHLIPITFKEHSKFVADDMLKLMLLICFQENETWHFM